MKDEERICGLYLRASTEDQAKEGFSLPEKKERLEALCKFKSYKIYDYYTDAGISAKTGNHRPKFDRLIDFDGNSYSTIANMFNKEKIQGKTNWKDTRILKILSNEIYKGDYVSGKTINKPVYYEDVVEPIVSKELWENCQAQKKKNQKNYSQFA